ncbi:hypothetical protein [Natronomonas marina]|jgi:hypothetical protein|uniref:hypothetical protein n=1 Tax=Natronomonas marina TaxID=2961939 RepID=UPI0020C94ED6|nr:hypothetical protein [Natronomonas marina]
MIRADLTLTPLHWLMILLSVTTGAIHVYIGLTDGPVVFVVLGVILFGGLAVFFTALFEPVLYLVGVVFVGVLFVVWILEGAAIDGVRAFDKLVQVVLAVVFFLLLFREEGGRSAPILE